APPAPVEVPAQAVAQPAAVQEAPPAEQPAAEQPAAAQPPEGLQEETFAVQQAPAAQAETAPVQPRSDLPDTELLQLQANGQLGRLSGAAAILDRGHAAVFRYRTSTIKERISSGLVEHFLDLLR